MPASPNTLLRDMSAVDVDNTTAETELFSYTIPAGTLSVDNAVKLDLGGDLLSNGGGAINFTWRVYLGGTVIWRDTISIGVDVDRAPWWFTLTLAAKGSDAEQILAGFGMIGFQATPTTGKGSWSTSANETPIWNGSIAVDCSVDQDFTVSVEMGTAHANGEVHKGYAHLVEV